MSLDDRPILGGPLTPVVIASGNLGADAGGTGPIYVSETWIVTATKDETLNDSDKEFTVPAGQEWQILLIAVEYASTGTVGNRQLELQVKNAGGDVIFTVVPGTTQAASLSYVYNFGAGMMDLTAVRDTTYVSTPIPPTLILKAFDSLRVYDNNAVDAAADDMGVFIQYAYRNV